MFARRQPHGDRLCPFAHIVDVPAPNRTSLQVTIHARREAAWSPRAAHIEIKPRGKRPRTQRTDGTACVEGEIQPQSISAGRCGQKRI